MPEEHSINLLVSNTRPEHETTNVAAYVTMTEHHNTNIHRRKTSSLLIISQLSNGYSSNR